MEMVRSSDLGLYVEGTTNRICCWVRYEIIGTSLGGNIKILVLERTLGFL